MQKRAEETREAIVQAAAEIFAEQGYAATTLRDITGRVDLTLGALYHYFESKQVLASDIIRRQHETSFSTLQSVTRADMSGIASIILLSRALAEQSRGDAIVRAGLRLSTESVDELATVTATPYRDWISACRVLLERASAKGETKPELDLDAAAEVIISAFSGTQFLAAALGRSDRMLEMLAAMWPIILAGVLADADDPVLLSIPDLLGVRASA